MKLLTMETGEHLCLIYSLAMVLDVPPSEIIERLGHDGQEVWWPKHRVPYSFRGVHIQEAVDLCLAYGRGLVLIELYPRTGSTMTPTVGRILWPTEDCEVRFKKTIHQRPGILIGKAQGGGHACAWDGDMVFDPNGKMYHLSEFKSLECWLLL